VAEAGEIIKGLQKRHPSDTLLKSYWLPSIRAALALHRRDAASALDGLQGTESYELSRGTPPFSYGATLYPAYLRGEAYLQQNRWSEAEAEFRKLTDRRGLLWNFPLAPLANLQIARARAGAHAEGARVAYRAFLAAWETADAAIPVYARARRETAALK
jgi:hypothetical protein